MKQAASKIPSACLELYSALVATNPRLERKGAAMPYTSVNGHMFSFLTPSGALALRLPAEKRDVFLKKYRTKLCEQHGVVLAEYVLVPHQLLQKTKQLKTYFDQSYAYVAGLKTKPTKKMKKPSTRTGSPARRSSSKRR